MSGPQSEAVPPASVPRTNILGVGISALDLDLACGVIGGWVERREPNYVCVTGVHGVMESQRDEALRAIHNRAGLVTPDGMPMVWLSRLAGRRNVRRVYGPDLMLRVCGESLKFGWRHYFYGGAQGVPELLAARLAEWFPGLAVAGAFSPPFRELTAAEEAEVAERIEACHADIVWVGLGTPKQERWMAAHVGRVGAPVLIGIGAAMDFHAGLKPQAPRWMQRSGLEWLHRMLSEPRRLVARYMVNNPLFLACLLLELVGLRRRRSIEHRLPS